MKIAAVQMDVALGRIEDNLARMTGMLEETSRAGAELALFPECAATGYCFDSLSDALPFGQPIPGRATTRIAEACARLAVYAAFGMLERDDKRLFNAAVLVGPEGLIGSYRKIHLPFLGVDRFTTPGDRAFAVHQTGPLRVGLNICYDASFPEAARSLALLGAELVVLPTNWPTGSECVAIHAINTRALENAIYFAAVNRVGTEGEFPFIGRSRICDPSGQTIASSDSSGETIRYADIDHVRARCMRSVRGASKHAIDQFADRRSDMYRSRTVPQQLERRGQNGERVAGAGYPSSVEAAADTTS